MGTMPAAEDQRLLDIATTIARGAPVDWSTADQTTTAPTAPTVLDALRAIDQLAQTSNRVPDTWGRATITGELGRGAYGTVYAAHDAALGIDLALKVVRPQGVDRAARLAEALNEARLLAQVNHPNIVRVYWAEAIGDEVGVAMELVQGRTLTDTLRQRGALPADETMAIGVDVCKALDAVHTANLLHGDIKAGNVMRTTGGRTVLMDFGVGQDLKVDDGAERRGFGTPLYLAPELFAGGRRSPLSDVYSAGVLLFHLVTNAYPIDARDARDVERHHAERRARRRLRDLRPDLPDAFVRVVDRAMADRPDDRFSSAADLMAALEQARKGLRRGQPEWLWPGVAAAATAGVLAVAVGYVWTTRPTPAVAVAPGPAAPVTAPPPAAPVDTYDIDVALYRHENNAEVRLASGARVAPGDDLSLRISATVPVYAYVVNEDDNGESYLLFPLPEQQLTNPLPPGTQHELPGMVGRTQARWEVSSSGGREHFLVFVSPQPPPTTLVRLFDDLPRPRFGMPIARRLSPELAVQLRGVGGLSAVPTNAASKRLADEFAVPLADAPETARGVWVRQLTLQNSATAK